MLQAIIEPEFQFLIGSVKSSEIKQDYMEVDLFQFLIGSVKRDNNIPIKTGGYKFQFLIGSVKSFRGQARL